MVGKMFIYDLYYYVDDNEPIFRKRHNTQLSAVRHATNLAELDDGYNGDGFASIILKRDECHPEPKRKQRLTEAEKIFAL